MSRTRTAVRLALGAALGVLAVAAPASASTIGVVRDGAHAYLRYAAQGGESNVLRVSTAPDGRLVFHDDGAAIITTGNACQRASDHEASCRDDAAPTVAISLGDRDDELVNDSARSVLAGGDAGNDRLTGGSASDGLWGGDGDDVLDGRGGVDWLMGDGGADTLRGRDGGIDHLFCGEGSDTAEADAADEVRDCEASAPTAPGGPAPGSTPTGSAPGTLTVPFSFTLGTVRIPEKPVMLHGALITVTMTCPETTPGGRCTGVITLERVVGADHHERPHAGASRHQRGRARIGDRAYALRAGTRARVSVRITRAERRRLARRGSDRVKVYLRTSKRAHRATRVGTLKVHASRRTKRRPSNG